MKRSMNPFNKRTKKTHSAFRIAAIAGAICALSTLATGDEVVLRDGTVYTGTILVKSRRTVEIETEIHGIKTQVKLDRRQIKSIIVGETETAKPDAAVTPRDSAPEMTTPAEDTKQILKRDGYNLILEVPMKGTFGQDIYPLGIANALEYALEQGVTDVVFRINSGGGEVWAATEIVSIMNEYRGEFKMHMLIESAISASIWPAFNCDTITMVPGADFGGAVVFVQAATGSAEVDLKMNSIWANKLSSAAEGNGYSGFIIRAMMLSKSAVYAKEQRDGTWKLYDDKEGFGENDEYDTISGDNDILTLTYNQAKKYGITDITAKGRSLQDFANVQDIDLWDNAGEFGHDTVDKDVKKCKQLRSKLQSTIQSFNREAGLQGGSLKQRGSALRQMTKHLSAYKRLLRQAGELRMPAITSNFEGAMDIAFWESEIEARKINLRNDLRGP